MTDPHATASKPDSGVAGKEDFGRGAGQVLELRVNQVVDLSRGLLDVNDPASVHQSWLVLRRLRTALDVFRPCFSKAEFRVGRDEVRHLLRPVGARRDVDAVIATFEEISAEMGESGSAGLRRALERLRHEQAEANRDLARAIHGRRLQAFGVRFEELAEAAGGAEGGTGTDVGPGEYRSVRYLPPKTIKLLIRRLDRLREEAPGALEPGAARNQRRMRTAAERLRYSLELTGDSLGTQAHTARRASRSLQEILTEIWNCNLAVPVAREQISSLETEDMATILERARGSRDLDPVLVQATPNRDSYRGLELALIHLGARRRMLLERLKRLWLEQSRQGVWVALDTSLRGSAE